MVHIYLPFLTQYIRTLLTDAVGAEYAEMIAETEGFAERVREDVETSSAWNEDETFSDDDVRLAVGRVLLAAVGHPDFVRYTGEPNERRPG